MDKTIKYDATQDDAFEARNHVEHVRSDSDFITVHGERVGRIISYKYHILQRDKAPLTGTFTREEVELLYRLYSSEGANVQQRTVSHYFPHLHLQQFKKILRAFNITKASSPMAPHLLEEKSTDDLLLLNQEHKEADFLKKVEQDKARQNEIRVRELYKENYELKQSIKDFKSFLSDVKIEVSPYAAGIKNRSKSKKTIVAYLSDMHIGADVSSYSIYENPYNLEIAKERIQKLYEHITNLALSLDIHDIVICNIGDSLDGYNGQTTRGGHLLPQNMNNKEQVKAFLEIMTQFFSSLANSGLFGSIRYYCVGEDNHSGDFGWIANTTLAAQLEMSKLVEEAVVFDKYMDSFTVDKHTIILCHGKDSKDVFRNMPLTLNDKIENQVNEYMDYKGIIKNVHFVKGDLHQSATTYGKRFRYKSVGSFFGSSEWIHKNFGNTRAVCDIDIFTSESVMETRLILN